MGKTVWIMNHYANHMLFDKGGRHYYFAKYLRRNGYSPVVFCANMVNSHPEKKYFENEKLINVQAAEEIDVPFVFVKVRPYTGNGKGRIMNMIDFYRNVKAATKEYAEKKGGPDVILASSVHPLTLVAGIQIARQFGVKCICEVRDLWPESLVAYGMLRRRSLLAKFLYAGEKWIYKKADRIVMTWPGGYDYIQDRGWEKEIPREKVCHISNGVDLEAYRENILSHPYHSSALEASGEVKFVYAGSVKKVNNLKILLEADEILEKRGVEHYQLFLFGDGDEREALEQAAKQAGLSRVIFAGRIPKQEVPGVLSQADVNILHNSSTSLDQYGQSQNKFFEYLAAGKPILMTYSVGHSVVKEERCGIEIERQTAEAVADAIQKMCELPEETIREYGENAARCAAQYDFKSLTEKLIAVIESL